MNQHKTRTLVVGGGFGGVKAALELSKSDAYAVTVLSDTPNFKYFPTMYHTATGGREAQSSIPLAKLFEGTHVQVAQGTATKLDRHKKVVKTADGAEYHYDILIVALGSVPNFFGIEGIKEYSYSIRTPEEARRFKNHLHKQLEDDREPDLNYVIVGGGPTGIELAGSLPGYLQDVMRAHGLRKRKVHVDLVEAFPHLVPRMPKRMGRKIERRLRMIGVKLYLGKTVQGETADALTVDGKPIQSHTVVWTAGVKNHPFLGENEFKLNERGKVIVDEYLMAEPDIYVLGDNADTKYSGMAQTALHDAQFVGKNLVRQAKGKLMKRYEPKEPVYVFPVGKWWAAVLWGKFQIYGLPGWILRELADLVAYKDYEPWWKAGLQWMNEFESQEDCKICQERLSR